MLRDAALLRAGLLEAVAAIDGAVAAWLEGHACFTSAAGALRGVHLTFAAIAAASAAVRAAALLRLARRAALGATRGVVGQPTARIKFLLTRGENEIAPAIAAAQGHISGQVVEPFS